MSQTRKFWFWAFLLGIFSFSAVLIWFLSAGLRLEIHNVSDNTLHDVVIEVATIPFPLGDIPPHQTRVARVRPPAPHTVWIQIEKTRRLEVPGQFEPGYRGAISVEVDDHQTHVISSKEVLGTAL